MPTSTERTRCVVLLPAEGELNGRLANALSSRNWQPTTHHDPYLALADLSLHDRAQASRAAWGLQSTERTVLVLGHRDVLDRSHVDCDALIAAARRFLPRIEIFEFTTGHLEPVPGGLAPRAVPVAAAPASMPDQTAAAAHPAASSGSIPPPGMLRLARPPEEPGAPAPTPAANGTSLTDDDEDDAETSARVTPEEIEMLLKLDDQEPPS